MSESNRRAASVLSSPRQQRRFHPVASSGFTLLEVVVVIALLSMIMLALGSALRTFSATDQRLQERKVVNEDVRLWGQFLRQTLSEVLEPTPTSLSEQLRAELQLQGATGTDSFLGQRGLALFDAGRQHLRWIGVMPANFGTHGKHAFLLSPRVNIDGRVDLVLWFKPWDGSVSFPDMTDASTRTVATNVKSFELAFGNDRDGSPQWMGEWADTARLPNRAKIDLTAQSQTWPSLVIRLRPLAGNSRSGGFSIGGN